MRHPAREIRSMAGTLVYLLLMGVLFRWDWGRMLQPLPLLSVLTGTCLLTAAQWRRGTTLRGLLPHLRWNAFLAGLLTSLLSLLSVLSGDLDATTVTASLADTLVPVLYGSLFALPWQPQRIPNGMADLSDPSAAHEIADGQAELPGMPASGPEQGTSTPPSGVKPVSSPAGEIHRLLRAHGFTPRECHVAQKLLEDASNREIAESLFISETTVKKHIQNLFRKCGATDRRAFRRLFHTWQQPPEA